MSEEKDEATLAAEKASHGDGAANGTLALMPQLVPSPGMPERQAVQRHLDRVMAILPSLPLPAQRAILAELSFGGHQGGTPGTPGAAPTQPLTAVPDDPQAREREEAQIQARAEAWKLAREREAAARREAAAGTEGEQPAGGPGSWPPDWPGGSG